MAKRVLLVEPSSIVAPVIAKYLQKSGYVVDVASSAQDAVHAADQAKPDVVVLELAMPRHNGFAFLQEFRSYQDWADIPVIIHSHLDVEEAALSKGWKTLGAVDYLYKPNTSLLMLQKSIDKVFLG